MLAHTALAIETYRLNKVSRQLTQRMCSTSQTWAPTTAHLHFWITFGTALNLEDMKLHEYGDNLTTVTDDMWL